MAVNPALQISIHALREEGDKALEEQRRREEISIHALREEGDVYGHDLWMQEVGFLSTPSARRATQIVCFLFCL